MTNTEITEMGSFEAPPKDDDETTVDDKLLRYQNFRLATPRSSSFMTDDSKDEGDSLSLNISSTTFSYCRMDKLATIDSQNSDFSTTSIALNKDSDTTYQMMDDFYRKTIEDQARFTEDLRRACNFESNITQRKSLSGQRQMQPLFFFPILSFGAAKISSPPAMFYSGPVVPIAIPISSRPSLNVWQATE